MLCFRHKDKPGVIVRWWTFRAGLGPEPNYTLLRTPRRPVSIPSGGSVFDFRGIKHYATIPLFAWDCISVILRGSLRLGHLFRGFQLLHGVLAVLMAFGFFIFWARTRFWLPKYAHILAAIGLLVGVWCVSTTPEDAPINKAGSLGKFLFALAVPAMVYFFFVFYGGQRAAMKYKPKTATEIADLIERFVNGKSLYPQEWNDFVESRHPDGKLDLYRKRCDELDPQVNCPDPQDAKALAELRRMVDELRSLSPVA
jgi:hypothetical protein